MNILFTICGRAGSKGVSNKNLRTFVDHPLPYYSLSVISLYMSEHPNDNFDIALNTDSQELIELIQKVSLPVHIVKRKAELAGDRSPKIAVVADTLSQMSYRRYDMVVDLDITSPLRTVVDLTNIIDKMSISKVDVVFSVTDARRNPYFNMVMKTPDGYTRVIKSNYNSRQEAPEIYDMNASLYAYSPTFLRTGKSIFSGRCDIIKMMDTAVLDIDHEQDFYLMEVIAKHLFQTIDEFSRVRNHINILLT